MQRVYHHHDLWEDYKSGILNIAPIGEQQGLIDQSLALLSNPEELGKAMRKVVENWKHSAEHNLTNTSINRQAFLGQAACCYNHAAPESLTKIAWWQLTDEQMNAANAVADQVIGEFERAQA